MADARSALQPLREFLCRSEAQTEDLAAALGAGLQAGDLVALEGDLGTGKTAFVRGLARGLEVLDPVSSPTYVLMHTYSGRLELYHFDAWMHGREEAFLEGGGSEWLNAGGVAAVEWAERVLDWLPRPHLVVRLQHAGASARRIRLDVRGEGDGRAERLERLLTDLPERPGDGPG